MLIKSTYGPGAQQPGDFPLKRRDFQLFSLPVGFQLGGEPADVGRGDIRRGGRLAPLQHARDRPRLESDVGVIEHLGKLDASGLSQLVGAADTQGQRQRRRVLPERRETFGVTGQRRVEVLFDLAA
jgi:hypothetical protein